MTGIVQMTRRMMNVAIALDSLPVGAVCATSERAGRRSAPPAVLLEADGS